MDTAAASASASPASAGGSPSSGSSTRSHVNGHRIGTRIPLLALPGAGDCTERIRAVLSDLG